MSNESITLATLAAEVSKLRSALESMCHQYLSVNDGKLHHDFMSAGEEAFEALGWDESGHPVDKQALCEVAGCGQSWTCGCIDHDRSYHCLCGHHHAQWIAAGHGETEDEGEARHVDWLRSTGASEADIAANKAFRDGLRK